MLYIDDDVIDGLETAEWVLAREFAVSATITPGSLTGDRPVRILFRNKATLCSKDRRHAATAAATVAVAVPVRRIPLECPRIMVGDMMGFGRGSGRGSCPIAAGESGNKQLICALPDATPSIM